MAVVYRCDRCGNDFNESNEVKGIAIPHMDRWNKFTDETNRYNKDLCASCWYHLIELTKPMPKAKEA